jgi:aryl-alcohol dehydrogenase-like predicted oxidoreductase
MSINKISRREFIKQSAVGAATLSVGTIPSIGFTAESPTKTINGMGYRTLGRTGLNVSEVMLGAGPMNPNMSNLLRAALSQGINYIDTGSGYGKGQSEIAIGQVVKSMGNRDKVIIASKASGVENSRFLKEGAASELEKTLRKNIEGSFKRLQTDYIDIYFCPHGARSMDEIAYPALREVLEKFKKEGKIRYTAVSTHTDYAALSLAAIKSGFYDVLMPVICPTTLNPKIKEAALKSYGIDTKKEGAKQSKGRPILDVREVLKAAIEKNIGLIAMKAAKIGFNPPEIHDFVKKELAPGTKLSFHQVAYRYVLDQPGISGVCIGMNNMNHLKEALVLSQEKLKG